MVYPNKQENFSDKSLPYKKFNAQKGRQIPQLSGKVNNLVAAPLSKLQLIKSGRGISWRDNFQPSK